MPDPVSIRTKNPGAMWPCAIATRFGSNSFEQLGDKQKNKAAIFPSFEQGAAAQFCLWAENYKGKTLNDAIRRWSGGNSSPEYVQFLQKHVLGLSMDTVITDKFLSGTIGCMFMKAQAAWEAGRTYPMSDDQWKAAQTLAFGGGVPPQVPPPQPPQQTNWVSSLISAILGVIRGGR